MRHWQPVEVENEDLWNEITDRIYLEPLARPGLCPSCGQAEVRYFYWRFDDTPGMERGGLWIWCPACLRYAHFSAYVPNWWQNPSELIARARLPPQPDWLEEHWEEVLAAGHPQRKDKSPFGE